MQIQKQEVMDKSQFSAYTIKHEATGALFKVCAEFKEHGRLCFICSIGLGYIFRIRKVKFPSIN